jgi:SAM-dependent methyltransferase
LNQYRLVYRLASQYLRAGDHALDWGSGNGHFSYFLKSRNVRLTAFAFDDAPVFMRDSPGYEHVQGDPSEPTRLPFADAMFDIAFSIGVLEHVHQTGGTETGSLLEIKRTLKPGGVLICVHFPNKYGWVEKVGQILGVADHVHPRKYVKRDIQRFAYEAGLTLEKSGRYNFLPRNQLWRLPRAISDTRPGVAVVNVIDSICAAAVPILTMNYYFVARRPA